jgi:hypothetical protein
MQRLSGPRPRSAVPGRPGNGFIERPAVGPAPARRSARNGSTPTASGGVRRAQLARPQTQRPGPARPQPPVFWSFCERCNRAFAQQLYAADGGPPEPLCSQRCGRERARDATVQRARSAQNLCAEAEGQAAGGGATPGGPPTISSDQTLPQTRHKPAQLRGADVDWPDPVWLIHRL